MQRTDEKNVWPTKQLRPNAETSFGDGAEHSPLRPRRKPNNPPAASFFRLRVLVGTDGAHGRTIARSARSRSSCRGDAKRRNTKCNLLHTWRQIHAATTFVATRGIGSMRETRSGIPAQAKRNQPRPAEGAAARRLACEPGTG
jgi:hypothetical protein